MAETLVYVIEAGGRYKIGWTSHLAERLEALQMANADVMVVRYQVATPHARAMEGYLKRHFVAQRLRGEWFALAPDDLAWIAALGVWEPPAAEIKLRPVPPHVRLGKPKHPLQQWREAQGWSQLQLARWTGLTQGMISHIERYFRIPLDDALVALLEKTHLPTEAFILPERFLAAHPDFLRPIAPKGPSHG